MFEVTFRDEFNVESEEQAYDELLDYLSECVRNQDVTAFTFVKLEKKGE